MNYTKIYTNLIEYRKQNIPDGYKENHHILPKSLGGTDDNENLVYLTGREHWVAHLLLHKIYKRSETIHACNMMAMRCEERGIPHIKSSRMYQMIREQHAKFISKLNKKTHIGRNNSQYGTMWICNVNLKENKKIKKDEIIPDGWVRGRNKWNIKSARKRLEKPYYITDGKTNRLLWFVDQQIPHGWKCGRVEPILSDDVKKRKSEKISQSNKNRKGIKYKK